MSVATQGGVSQANPGRFVVLMSTDFMSATAVTVFSDRQWHVCSEPPGKQGTPFSTHINASPENTLKDIMQTQEVSVVWLLRVINSF